MLAGRQGCPSRGGILRKPQAKRWLDEQEAYQAVARDEKANIFKVQNLYGTCGRRCDGHKREGRCALPGEVCRDADVSRSRIRMHRLHPRAKRDEVAVVLTFVDEGDAE